MDLIYMMNCVMGIKKDECGNVSIESMIVLPVIILIYITFVQLISYFKISDIQTYNMVNEMLQNQLDQYESYKNNKIEYTVLNENKAYFATKDTTKTISFEFSLVSNTLGKDTIKYSEEKTVRKFVNGDSVKDYKLASNFINGNENVWELPNIIRAQEISKLLGGTVNFNGNSVDKIVNNKIVSIVSLDTRKDSYSEENKILGKLKVDIDRLISFKEGDVDGKFVSKKDYKDKVLHLVIPETEINSNLEMELLRVRNYCRSKNIELKISSLTGG